MQSQSSEMIGGGLVIANAIFIGMETEYKSRHHTDPPHVFFKINVLFAWAFGTELILKLMFHRVEFFCGDDLAWNLFDTVLVLHMSLDLLDFYSLAPRLNVLRILRLLRIIRL